MGETLLKQEFREKDVKRLRNIMTKKYGDSVTTQVGYVKKEEEHTEGDIWEDGGKTWTIKNGIKQTYTKLDGVKAAVRMPLSCPQCGTRMKGRIDAKMYSIHKCCSTCVAKKETEMKLNGRYQDYIKQFVGGNILTYLDDAEQFISDYAAALYSKYVTEDGDIEDISGKDNREKMIEKWKSEIEEMRKNLLNKND